MLIKNNKWVEISSYMLTLEDVKREGERESERE